MMMRQLVTNIPPEQFLPLVFLYVGPETILPLTSFLAAIIGILLMMWQRVIGGIRMVWNACFKKSPPAVPAAMSTDSAELPTDVPESKSQA